MGVVYGVADLNLRHSRGRVHAKALSHLRESSSQSAWLHMDCVDRAARRFSIAACKPRDQEIPATPAEAWDRMLTDFIHFFKNCPARIFGAASPSAPNVTSVSRNAADCRRLNHTCSELRAEHIDVTGGAVAASNPREAIYEAQDTRASDP